MVAIRSWALGVGVLVAIMFVGYGTMGRSSAEPEVKCSNQSHTIFAVDNATKGDGKLVRISCLSDDSSSTSKPTVGSGGQDAQVQCESGDFVVSSGREGSLDYLEATCPSKVKQYYNGTVLKTVGEDGNFIEDQLELPSSGSFKVSLNGEATLDGEHYCGKGAKQVRISFDIGCLGNAYDGPAYNPVHDMLFALLRFVSVGVGLIVTGSIVWAGIQYSTSRGNPQSTEASIKRVTNAVIALLIYIFAWAILNFLVPGGLFL